MTDSSRLIFFREGEEEEREEEREEEGEEEGGEEEGGGNYCLFFHVEDCRQQSCRYMSSS